MNPSNAASPATARQLLEAQYRESLAAVTERMFAVAGIGPGQRVLDIGSGSGDTALIAAEWVGPTGRVLATDVTLAAMQGLAAHLRAQPRSLPIALEAVAAESLTQMPGSFDVVLARNCVMYFTDLPRALANIRAALRTGGRFVASVYGPLAHEPFHDIPIAAVRRRCPITEPYPDYVQAFRAGADVVGSALRSAGFQSVERHVVPTSRSFPSVPEAIEALRLSRSLAQLLSVLPESLREDAWTDIEAGFRDYESASGLRIPGEQVVLAATP
ncbi:MAG: methyltransferase domain-containing protein [Gammaproteobacteria bacterium]|nr:methyltransferase domain-containing protein [Gammaproteobacteria bacterium]